MTRAEDLIRTYDDLTAVDRVSFEIGLVKRKVISTSPIAVAYEITDFCRSSLTVLEQLKDWAEAGGL